MTANPKERTTQYYACEHGIPGGCGFCNATEMEARTKRIADALMTEGAQKIDELIAERDRLRERVAELEGVLERIDAIYGKNSARMAPMIAGNDQMEPLMVEVSAVLAKARP